MTRPANILVVEDDAAMRETCVKLFRLEGFGVHEASTASEALDHIQQQDNVDIVLTDLKMKGMDGLSLLRKIKQLDPGIEVVLMTGYGSIKNAVEAMKHGAADYITKPFDTDELLTIIDKTIELTGLKSEVSRLRLELHEKYRFDNLVGGSSMRGVYEKIEAARNTNASVLICGESGTGKELVAKAIHYNGRRANGPFVPVNCAAMPRDLIESELFGHRKGAFTSATTDSIGLFRAAVGGTIFLDEILEMPYGVQAKLLRALQEKRVRPVGGAEEIPIDVRVIASTNQNVQEAIRNNTFRQDIYYRVGVIIIELPPLRRRVDDIPALARHFIAKFNRSSHRTVTDVSKDALAALSRYRWPGNVRELESVIESAFAMGKASVIQKSDLPTDITGTFDGHAQPSSAAQSGVQTLSEAEREALLQALELAGGNKTRAAQLLGVSRPKLYKMMERHDVQRRPAR